MAGTSVNYLYQISTCRREPKVGLAFRIEQGTRHLSEQTHGRLPVVTAADLAVACVLEGM